MIDSRQADDKQASGISAAALNGFNRSYTARVHTAAMNIKTYCFAP